MASPVPRLSDHFPRVEAKCAKPAKVFFECFFEATKMTNKEVQASAKTQPVPMALLLTLTLRLLPQDADAGRRGLAKCLTQMEAYDKCMVPAIAKKPVEMYRVSYLAVCNLLGPRNAIFVSYTTHSI
jgi:hypothetical protein